jgi:hypothetical protein
MSRKSEENEEEEEEEDFVECIKLTKPQEAEMNQSKEVK